MGFENLILVPYIHQKNIIAVQTLSSLCKRKLNFIKFAIPSSYIETTQKKKLYNYCELLTTFCCFLFTIHLSAITRTMKKYTSSKPVIRLKPTKSPNKPPKEAEINKIIINNIIPFKIT